MTKAVSNRNIFFLISVIMVRRQAFFTQYAIRVKTLLHSLAPFMSYLQSSWRIPANLSNRKGLELGRSLQGDNTVGPCSLRRTHILSQGLFLSLSPGFTIFPDFSIIFPVLFVNIWQHFATCFSTLGNPINMKSNTIYVAFMIITFSLSL